MRAFRILLKNEMKMSIRGMDMPIFALIMPIIVLVILGIVLDKSLLLREPSTLSSISPLAQYQL